MDQAAVEALKNPASWPHPVTDVTVVETHASWVFLTGEFAYKIKKPVDFGFLDFSTLEKRLHCCREELRLNRRLAPELYLEVVSLAGSPPRVGGDGEAVEYAVKMRQFDVDCGFDRLAGRGALDPARLDEAAAVLARFHDEAEQAGPDSDFATPEVVTRQVLENFEQMAPYLGERAPGRQARFDSVADWSREACRTHRERFAARLADGFVRECHGDLHLRNIVWWRERVVPFDCIEFNPALRWIDVMSEIAFLTMDLDDHDLSGLSRRLLDGYLAWSGDFGGLGLLRFYQAYRAMVRAKVASLELAQRDRPDAAGVAALEAYLDLASRYTRPLNPRLVIAHGLSGSGKTYVSQRLLEAAPLVRLRSDVERKRLFGLTPLESSGSAQDAGIYTVEATNRTYDRLARLAGGLLDDGWPVLVDAAFLERSRRERFQALAEDRDVPFTIMHCEAEMDVQRERVARRTGDASEADLAVLDAQRGSAQPLEAKERDRVISVDTTGAPRLEPLLAMLAGDGA